MYISSGVKAQEERSFIREGNANFNEADYLMADSMFLKALAINPESIEAQYLGQQIIQVCVSPPQ